MITWKYESQTDKAMQILVGFGLTSVIFMYTVLDSVRFLPDFSDKILCVLSSIILKPILLPLILPGTCFRSPVAIRRPGKYVHKYDGITETRFMMAVQETNFLMTFTLAGISAMCTFFAVATQGQTQELPLDTMFVSLAYGVFGLVIAVWMYGRKVPPHHTSNK